jgi:hypothetical protein
MDKPALYAVRSLRLATGAWLLTMTAIPFAWLERLPVHCLLRPLLGKPCPGCGLSHSVWSLLHGQIGAAFRWNPMGFAALPLAVAFAGTGFAGAGALLRKAAAPLRIPAAQARAALLWVWAVVSVTMALILVSSAAVPEQTLYRVAPACQYRLRYGRPCVLCGMTHAFVSISRFRISQARRENPLGPLLYGAMAANALFFGITAARRLTQRRRRSSRFFPRVFSSTLLTPHIQEDSHADTEPRLGHSRDCWNDRRILPLPGELELAEHPLFGNRPDH